MKIETQLRAAAAFYFAIAATATLIGCAQKPQTVAVDPSPAPTANPTAQPTLAPVIIQSNEPPPPAMFRPAPDVTVQPRRAAPAQQPRQQPRRAQTAPQTNRAPAETQAQVMSQLRPQAIANVIGDKLLNAETPREINEQLVYLARLQMFYTVQRNNPTMMSRARAIDNLTTIRALSREGNLKLRIASGLVPIESREVLSMNARNGIISAQQFAGAFGSDDNTPDAPASGNPMDQETFGQWQNRQLNPNRR